MSASPVVRAWRPRVPGVREVFHARFDQHAYPRHTHDTWTVLIVDRGDIRFALDGRPHGSVASSVTVLPPHVTHDGRAGRSGSFVKRVLYLDDTYLDDRLVGRAVDQPTFADPVLRASLAAAHGELERGGDPLAAEIHLHLASERLAARLRRRDVPAGPPERPLAEAARDLLDAHLWTGITLQELGTAVGASPAHLARSFTARFAVSPHAYLLGRRIDAARRLLLEGMPAAEVAAEVGFHDQSHLHRHFVRHVGTTPGRFARGLSRAAGGAGAGSRA